ncbi:MAG: DNA primase [Muribaculaceae bacterium]|nr:DNA primase [Muribaculaceae bacterium]
MKKIDRETVQKILDTADIVEVVSDFVSLKRRGANYIGLCPFHNERTPSFSVSKAKGICKCFSCGKGGSPVNFLMELEQMTYQEALRYLAKKYNIEIQEHEESEQERKIASEREGMLGVNEFALKYFNNNLFNTDAGKEIGLTYFRHRGISDAMIERFKLGYALESPTALSEKALAEGYQEEYLVRTGLCSKNERGSLYDRFRGRVIYPVHSVSGKVVAFGGRTLSTDKKTAKYINSPESLIYSKSKELYGLYQAKQSISKKDRCILVEGYMDVISMVQSGVENVVASSGTSLTDGQVRLIHRFTDNVTVIYDSDAAGIKASLRGIDLLLAEGLNVHVLLLPDGDDPDSFAQSHTPDEVEEYLKANQVDFIQFKTDILLKESASDPVARAKVVDSILQSVSVIPNEVTRAFYIDLCSRELKVDAQILRRRLAKLVADGSYKRNLRAGVTPLPQTESGTRNEPISNDENGPAINETAVPIADEVVRERNRALILRPYEEVLIKLILRYGLYPFCDDMNGNPLRVLEYVRQEFSSDGIVFSSADYRRCYEAACELADTTWSEDRKAYELRLPAEREKMLCEGREYIAENGKSVGQIKQMESELSDYIENTMAEAMNKFDARYLFSVLSSGPDDELRKMCTDMVADRYQLSKIHTKFTKVETESERLVDLLPRAVYELKYHILNLEMEDLGKRISQEGKAGDFEAIKPLLQELMERQKLKAEFARYLGERILQPDKLPKMR